MTDPYEVLGVPHDASAQEIKRAWRARARELHPDRNPAPDAAERFRELTDAWELLSDPHRRGRWDRSDAESSLPHDFLADFTDAVERAEALVFRSLLPFYASAWRGPGAEVAARFAEAVTTERLEEPVPPPTWRGRRRARGLQRRIRIEIRYGPAFDALVADRSGGGWRLTLHPDVFWREGLREAVRLDDAVLSRVAAYVAVLLAHEARYPIARGSVEDARRHDTGRIARRRRELTFWLLVALACAALLYAGLTHL